MGGISRIVRVNEILKREIADLVERDSPGGAGLLVSVTEVNTSPDLRNAEVMVSVFGGDKEAAMKVIKHLKSNRGDIQRRMAKHVVLKYTPVLSFHLDTRIAAGDSVLQIINELEQHDDPDTESDAQ